MNNRAMTFELPADFYLRYWQREPLFIPNAIANFAGPISGDELAGLACLPTVESRLVIERDCAVAWEVRHGPFERQEFANLPESHWTLLVHAVDHWDDAVSALHRLFPEIPNWRIDDVMVSYAVDGGSVGPHSDSYDVFLLQGAGSRRWHLGGNVESNAPLQSHNELRLLKEFSPVREYLLRPGDALYLPPNYAHWGIAEGECMTFSLGYRAPSHAEIIDGFASAVIGALSDDMRYRDPGIGQSSAHPGEISRDVILRMRAIIEENLTEENVEAWLGTYATERKYDSRESNFDEPEATNVAQPSTMYSVRLDSRFAFSERASGLNLYVNGQRIECPSSARSFVERLCDGHCVEDSDIAMWPQIVVELLRLDAIEIQ